MSYKRFFLQQVENLVKELVNILPGNSNVELFKEKFYLIRKMNNILIINSFIRYVLPYKKQIEDHNEKFFLDGGGQEDISKDNYKFTLDIKKDWNSISADNKEIIWKYFNILILLSEKYICEKMTKSDSEDKV